jgi:hypothetical protein
MKIIKWVSNNILFVITLFLLSFIPLYPKLPLLDIKNTWVYIRVEDFLVFFVLSLLAVLLFRKKISIRTPLTMPILLFWIVGAIATIHGILLIFPTLANVYPNVAFLSYMRRIEYLSIFFVAFAAIKEKRYFPYIIGVLSVTLFLVCAYGIGQRYMGFPAYLTMNEEFAKGEPIRLSPLSRVPSTFAGHYDLAAYLVLIIPIIASLIFGVKKWFLRLSFLALIGLGFIVMFMTVSRVSFIVLLIALGIVLLFQKKKIVIFSLPIIIVFGLALLSFFPALIARYGNTLQEVDVLIDAQTGQPIGHALEVPSSYFKDKLIMQDFLLGKGKVEGAEIFEKEKELNASSSAVLTNGVSTPSGVPVVIDYTQLPDHVTLLVTENTPNGENLPQGTGYINLSLSPVIKKTGSYFYEYSESAKKPDSADVVIINGNYLVKRAVAYDLSFTTRFQGEWPHAMEAFMRNVLFGSGYGSISLAIDNNYYRILGEVGALGAAAFLLIFVTTGIYIYKMLPHVDSRLTKSFVIGYVAGIIGLALNAAFIDVFEASKVAFVLWLLTGVTLGVLHTYQKGHIDLYTEIKRVATSKYAVIFYLGIVVLLIFSPMINNYFVGDDFTWFRWAAEDKNIVNYFLKADGFFYRPGTKVYFLLMYSMFWLNQVVYHSMSIFLHFVAASLVFLLARKVLRDNSFAAIAAVLFVVLSGYSEAIFWISSTGYLFTAIFSLASVLLYIHWNERKNIYSLIFSVVFLIVGLLFHELGVVTPLLILLYIFATDHSVSLTKVFTKLSTIALFLPIGIYASLRFIAGSHWTGGDYSYNLMKLPLNFIGNTIGYLMITAFGSLAMPGYQIIRNEMRDHLVIAFIMCLLLALVAGLVYLYGIKKIKTDDRRILIISIGFFIIGLLPFLGLGNITSRYSYLASVGFVFLAAFLLKKIYSYLYTQGREIASGVLLVILGIFLLLHLMQTQQIHGDWRTAGNKAERFLTALDEVYADYWSKEPMTFYFINVPIKTGEAWVFPVGLKDAMWFSFRNPHVTINQVNSVSEALQLVDGSKNQKVFEFLDTGKIVEHKKKVLSPSM